MKSPWLLVLTLTGSVLSRAATLPAAPASVPLTKPSGAGNGTLFTPLPTSETGVEFTNRLDLSHPWKYLYASSMSTGGVAVGDVNGDGRPDIFLTNGPGPNKLFLQTADWKWQEKDCGLDGAKDWAVGCAMADVDGDGDIDIYVCNYLTPNALYLNNGDGTFTECAKERGVAFLDASHTPSFCDYDHDGDLDLYVLTNRWYRPEGFPNEKTIEIGPDGRPRVLPQWEKYYDAVQIGPGNFSAQVVGRPDILAKNDGKGHFEVVTEKVGIKHRGHGLSATWFDWNGDGWEDLWVGNDFDDADHLYKNNRDGTFTDVTDETVDVTTWFSMGADFGDVNGDGLPDFFIADMAGSTHFKQKTAMGSMGDKTWFMEYSRPNQLMRNCLFINAGNGRFMEAGFLAGLGKTNWTWAVRLADFDCDGKNDVYVQSGMARNFNEKDDPKALLKDPTKTQWDRYEHLPPMKEQNLAYRNEGGLKFTETSKAWGLDYVGMSYGCTLADLDRDGDPDIVSVLLDEPVRILRNDAPGGHRVLLKFAGTKSNRLGIGAKVRLTTAAGVQIGQNTPTRGYLGCGEPMMTFGLGEAATLSSLEVTWPSGAVQKWENLPADRFYTLAEPADATPAAPVAAAEPLFVRLPVMDTVIHREQRFDDFAREPLLPNRLSHQGPGQAWADIDGDGDDDLLLSAGRGQAPQLLINTKGTFSPANPNPFQALTGIESLGVLFFEANGDGRPDAFIVSGGVECAPGDASLQDRLFLGDGRGGFTEAPAGTPPAETDSGSAVVAADFDRDGDLDLFVGGRSVPGAYPLPGKSHLLRNDGGKFTDITAAQAPTLAEAGMVTGAVWTDADGDGWTDLFLVAEWGAPRLFLNKSGTLAEAQGTGLEKLTGWWNGIAAGDFDGDGDMDYAVTNFGLNTKYHATPDHPVMTFYGDLDGTGKNQIVEAEYEGSTLYPVRGRSCSSQAMPFIKEKFPTFKAFAQASLQDIYGKDKLSKVRQFSAVELASGALINDGKAHFTFRALPWPAQTAPGFGVVVTDADADGHPDLVIAQNFAHPQVETGKLLTGLSLLLKGDGTGAFDPVWPDKSGISVPADPRSLALLDLDADGRQELCIGLNFGPVLVFSPSAKVGAPTVRVRLEGPAGNPTAAGARLTARARGLAPQTVELAAGSGYLSQSSATVPFVADDQGTLDSLTVRWPDGTEQKIAKPQPIRGIVTVKAGK